MSALATGLSLARVTGELKALLRALLMQHAALTWHPVTCAGSGKSALAAELARATGKPQTLLFFVMQHT